eukprot:jgi/Chrpa1/3836/Chrysochromulina_OHIO_Genome00015267-RA
MGIPARRAASILASISAREPAVERPLASQTASSSRRLKARARVSCAESVDSAPAAEPVAGVAPPPLQLAAPALTALPPALIAADAPVSAQHGAPDGALPGSSSSVIGSPSMSSSMSSSTDCVAGAGAAAAPSP